MAKTGAITIWLVDKAERNNYYWGEGSMFAVANYLTDYFNKVCQHSKSPFETARCSWQKGVAGENDLVIYFLSSSKESIIYKDFKTSSTCQAPSGGTIETSQGMVSEVYMDTMQGDMNYCKLVANLAFHELMHNKLDAPTINPTVSDIHALGGSGLAQATVARGTQITDQNIALMAGALGKKVRQYTAKM
jgi:hypothetical protein